MALFTVTIDDNATSYRCSDSQTLLEGMENLGKKGIPVGCRGGGCGVCKVQVLSGTYTKRVMSREHVSAEEEALGFVLACRVRPTSAMELRVIGSMKKNVCRVVEPAGALSLST